VAGLTGLAPRDADLQPRARIDARGVGRRPARRATLAFSPAPALTSVAAPTELLRPRRDVRSARFSTSGRKTDFTRCERAVRRAQVGDQYPDVLAPCRFRPVAGRCLRRDLSGSALPS